MPKKEKDKSKNTLNDSYSSNQEIKRKDDYTAEFK